MEKETTRETIRYNGKEYFLYELPFLGQIFMIFFMAEEYMNGNLAVTVMNVDSSGAIDTWTSATVNLGMPLPEGYAYADTNNNDWLLPLLKEHKLATMTHMTAESGFCKYPLLKWNWKQFKK